MKQMCINWPAAISSQKSVDGVQIPNDLGEYVVASHNPNRGLKDNSMLMNCIVLFVR